MAYDNDIVSHLGSVVSEMSQVMEMLVNENKDLRKQLEKAKEENTYLHDHLKKAEEDNTFLRFQLGDTENMTQELMDKMRNIKILSECDNALFENDEEEKTESREQSLDTDIHKYFTDEELKELEKIGVLNNS